MMRTTDMPCSSLTSMQPLLGMWAQGLMHPRMHEAACMGHASRLHRGLIMLASTQKRGKAVAHSVPSLYGWMIQTRTAVAVMSSNYVPDAISGRHLHTKT
jgi:hypothetical protein